MTKKIKILIAFLLIVTFSITACNTPSDTTASSETTVADTTKPDSMSNPLVSETDYQVFLYSSVYGTGNDTVTPRYQGKLSESNFLIYKKEDITEKKTLTLFGKTIEYEYDRTTDTRVYPNPIDNYFCSGEKAVVAVAFDEKTDKLVRYYYGLAGINNVDNSQLNGDSTYDEFLEYAKGLLSDFVDSSDCEAEVQTVVVWENEYGCEMRERFEGFIKPELNKINSRAFYGFTFYKTIDGIKRSDTAYIEISINTGEVRQINLRGDTETMDLFQNVKIDRAKLREAVESLHISASPDYLLLTDGESLWVRVKCIFAEYIIKVAEIVDDTKGQVIIETTEEVLSTFQESAIE